MKLLDTVTSAVTGFFGSFKAYLIVGGVALAIGLGSGAYAGYRWELGEYNALKLADADALLVATKNAADRQHRLDLSGQSAAVDEAYFRGHLDATIITLKTGAPANVTILQDQQAAAADHAGCLTYGFERMLVAGERGVTPDSLPLPPGQSVDACTADEPSDLAARLAQDLATGFGNSEQLDAVLGELKKQTAILGQK